MDVSTLLEEIVSKRSDVMEIKRQQEKVSLNATLTSLLDTMPHIVLILNLNRQIVWANRYLLDVLKKRQSGHTYSSKAW